MARETRTTGRPAGAAKERPIPSEEVAKVAYGLFEQRGCAPGHDLEDWLKAEEIVRKRQKG